jgi:ATP-dependent DNA ligase
LGWFEGLVVSGGLCVSDVEVGRRCFEAVGCLFDGEMIVLNDELVIRRFHHLIYTSELYRHKRKAQLG